MKSPIKNLKNKTNSFTTITQLIPKGSVVDYYPIYSGDLPIKLSESDRFVVAHTPNYVVYEFWKCLFEDPERVSRIAESFYPILNENTFDILKKNWFSYKDPFVRSALFFLLNRCSDLGMITHGDLNTKNYNAFALRDLKTFKANNLHLNLLKKKSIYDFSENINVFNCDKYRISFLENEEVLGQEETHMNHQELIEKMSSKKCILLFKAHPALFKLKGYGVIAIDKHGRETTEANAKEVILHNV